MSKRWCWCRRMELGAAGEPRKVWEADRLVEEHTADECARGGILLPQGKARRGFAAMDPNLQRRIAANGGRKAHANGTAHEFTPAEARLAGQKGGKGRWKPKADGA